MARTKTTKNCGGIKNNKTYKYDKKSRLDKLLRGVFFFMSFCGMVVFKTSRYQDFRPKN